MAPVAALAEDHNYLVPTGTYDSNCNEGSPGSGHVCQTDNAYVTWYMDSHGEFELEAPDRADVNTALDQNYRPTDLSFHYQSDPEFTGGSETDFIYQEGYIPDGYVGYAWCNDVEGFFSHQCDQTYIRIRGDGRYTPGLVCHETGHAVGLVHGEDTTSQYDNQDSTHMGCMVKSNVPAAAVIRSAQESDIDDVYPN